MNQVEALRQQQLEETIQAVLKSWENDLRINNTIGANEDGTLDEDCEFENFDVWMNYFGKATVLRLAEREALSQVNEVKQMLENGRSQIQHKEE